MRVAIANATGGGLLLFVAYWRPPPVRSFTFRYSNGRVLLVTEQSEKPTGASCAIGDGAAYRTDKGVPSPIEPARVNSIFYSLAAAVVDGHAGKTEEGNSREQELGRCTRVGQGAHPGSRYQARPAANPIFYILIFQRAATVTVFR